MNWLLRFRIKQLRKAVRIAMARQKLAIDHGRIEDAQRHYIRAFEMNNKVAWLGGEPERLDYVQQSHMPF